jgi:FkbM family methyltransferase
MKLENFFYKRSGKERYAFETKRDAYKALTKNSPKFFFLAGDNLPIEPLVTGAYEPHIRDCIDYAAACGNADFLIDIGANIGLTSCQSGRHFKEVHLFEPNPSCIAILKLNTRIALGEGSYRIYEYGLGESSRVATLRVPVGNMGGAFIHDGLNSYSEEILAMKDNFNSIEKANYVEESIRIESAQTQIHLLFTDLMARGLCSGVVKIDVEGYEPIILNALTQVPEQMGLTIIFESWDKDYNFTKLLKTFKGRATGYRLKAKRSYESIFHRLLKKIDPRFAANDDYQLVPFSGKDASGDLVVSIAKAV